MCAECHQNPCHPSCPNDSEEPIAHCSNCGCEIYESEPRYRVYFTDTYFCVDCISKEGE